MLEVADSSLAQFAQQVERRRIARELHDSVVQSLTALVADLEYFRSRRHAPTDDAEVEEKLEAWQELARDSLTSMRQTLGNLRTTSFEDSFERAVEKLLQDFHDAGYTLTYESTDWPSSLPPEYTMHLYSIIREALTNISKHAQASHITVFLFSHEQHLHMSIADNGIGMRQYHHHTQKASGKPAYECNGYHQGLPGMQERTMLLGGQLSIESTQGKGTRIDVDIPFTSLAHTFGEH